MINAKQITTLLNGTWYGSYGNAYCPCHNNTRTPALSISEDNGKLLVYCHAGCDGKDVLKNIRDRFDLDYINKESTDNRQEYINKILSECTSIQGTIAEKYLCEERKITTNLNDNLLFHKKLKHISKNYYPCLIVKIQKNNSDQTIAIQRIYLTNEGKKIPLIPNKMLLEKLSGGYALLTKNSTNNIVVGEDVETSLSLKQFNPDKTVLSAISSSGMKNLDLPLCNNGQTKQLLIGCDNDDAGLSAAQHLARKASALGWTVNIVTPPENKDWNDIDENEFSKFIPEKYNQKEPIPLITEDMKPTYPYPINALGCLKDVVCAMEEKTQIP